MRYVTTRFLVPICAVLAGSGVAMAAPSISVTDAVTICEGGFPPPGGSSPSAARRNTCVAYIDGVIATVLQIAAMAQVPAGAPPARAIFCIPPAETYENLSAAFIRYARANPKLGDRAAASIFIAAFAAGYPCK